MRYFFKSDRFPVCGLIRAQTKLPGLVFAAITFALSSQYLIALEKPADFENWKRGLLEPAKPRVYESGIHTDARLPLGGIGTGNFEVGADGRYTSWIFNTKEPLRNQPLCFAVKIGTNAMLLQTSGGPNWPRVQQIKMTGEYPLASLSFQDPKLPVELDLSVFTPFSPLDTSFSSWPLGVFVFRVRNSSAQVQKVSLAGFMANPIGDFGGKVNDIFTKDHSAGLVFRAEPGKGPELDERVQVLVLPYYVRYFYMLIDVPTNVAVGVISQTTLAPDKLKEPQRAVILLEDVPVNFNAALLGAVVKAVESGATAVFSGKTFPLLKQYAQMTGGKHLDQTAGREIVMEDFEKDYARWKVEGAAFGTNPVAGTLPGQAKVSGFVGKGLVNSYALGDKSVGKMVGHPFVINRNYISFLVGGGNQTNTAIRLVVGGKVVRQRSGQNTEELYPYAWDVKEFSGQEARLEIVDEATGDWGHIEADHIVQSDNPVPVMPAWLSLEKLLPARFSGISERTNNLAGQAVSVEFANMQLETGAEEKKTDTGHKMLVKPFGQGKVVLLAGSCFSVADGEAASLAHQQLLAFLSGLVGAKYVLPEGISMKSPAFGTMALVTSGKNPSILPKFDGWDEAWDVFSRQGCFSPLDQAKAPPPSVKGKSVSGAVAATVDVPPGEIAEIPFLLSWHYPNSYHIGKSIGCYYTTLWPDARAVASDALEKIETFRGRTELFRKTFYDSTLPYWLLDCLSSQISTIRYGGVVFRIANGDVYGFEGSCGCCGPTCTHVWGYEQTMARLFPDLERDMRRIDYKHQQGKDGGINNRTAVPSPPQPTGEGPFTDGHASCILKAYREALNQPDEKWMREYWPNVKQALEYLIERDAKTSGGKPCGVLNDAQFNTYDQALHGVTTFIGTYYLAALRAGEEWAKRMGDQASADRYHGIYESGRKKLVEMCWNGEYFQQNLPDYEKRDREVGPGCMSDQLIGQWWAHQLGLGYLLPKDMVLSALRSVYKYNWKQDLTGWKHMPRAFAGAGDKGLIICTWPKGGRPKTVMLYSDEIWTGIEYQVAAHMIYEGMLEEGFAIIKGARDRYDGIPRPPVPRNPWNEIECGGHYVRAMSSWSILPALSGWLYDGPAGDLRIAPGYKPENFKAFFTGPEGWGSLLQIRQDKSQANQVMVVEGQMKIARLMLNCPWQPQVVSVSLAGKNVPLRTEFATNAVSIVFGQPFVIKSGQSLEIDMK